MTEPNNVAADVIALALAHTKHQLIDEQIAATIARALDVYYENHAHPDNVSKANCIGYLMTEISKRLK